MFKLMNAAVLVVGLTGATMASAGTANAAGIGISFGVANVAFGYQDGYWDQGHRWHHWRNQSDARAYRASAGNQYHAWNHNRDANHGWQR